MDLNNTDILLIRLQKTFKEQQTCQKHLFFGLQKKYVKHNSLHLEKAEYLSSLRMIRFYILVSH